MLKSVSRNKRQTSSQRMPYKCKNEYSKIRILLFSSSSLPNWTRHQCINSLIWLFFLQWILLWWRLPHPRYPHHRHHRLSRLSYFIIQFPISILSNLFQITLLIKFLHTLHQIFEIILPKTIILLFLWDRLFNNSWRLNTQTRSNWCYLRFLFKSSLLFLIIKLIQLCFLLVCWKWLMRFAIRRVFTI